jgi:hypothetical protein
MGFDPVKGHIADRVICKGEAFDGHLFGDFRKFCAKRFAPTHLAADSLR